MEKVFFKRPKSQHLNI